MARSIAAPPGEIHRSNVTPHGYSTTQLIAVRPEPARVGGERAVRLMRHISSPFHRSRLSQGEIAGNIVAAPGHMALTLLAFQSLLVNEDRVYRARSCGRERDDGTWEGWIEFVPEDGGPVLASARETTQPNLTDLQYWATGLTPVYLEGALERALTRTPRPAPGPPDPPAYDGPGLPGVPPNSSRRHR